MFVCSLSSLYKEPHLKAVNRIFKYLKGHIKIKSWHPRKYNFDLKGYVDADFVEWRTERALVEYVIC